MTSDSKMLILCDASRFVDVNLCVLYHCIVTKTLQTSITMIHGHSQKFYGAIIYY